MRGALLLLPASTFAGCSSGSGLGTTTPSTAPEPTQARSFGHISYRSVPGVGEVEVERLPELGLTIVDRATQGDRFFLSTPEAETCLEFLAKRPRHQEIIEALCVSPGRVR